MTLGDWSSDVCSSDLALGYVAIGLAFGVVAAASGLSALEVGDRKSVV